MIHRFYGLICLCISILAPVSGANAAALLDIAVEGRQETILLAPGNVSPHKVFTLSNPERLVVDVPALPADPGVNLPSRYKGGLVDKVRYGRFDRDTSRFVFDLSGPVRVVKVRKERSGKKERLAIVIDGSREAGAPSGNDRQVWPKASKGGISDIDYGIPQDQDSVVKPKEKNKKTTNAPFLKRGKPVIVIDPGHGGLDPGAEGRRGSLEKHIVLAYAKALRDRLQRSGRYEVMLTRDDDTFIMLRKRVDIARKAGASLFISLHADSADGIEAQGLSVYTVSEKASDEEAEALAARENKADILAGMDLSDEREDVASILISLAERDTKNRSATLADMLVTSLDDRVQLLPNSHRFAGFAVLKAPDVPSVLVEIGFLSHPKEEKLINSKAYRNKVVAGIAAGIDRYFAHEKKMSGQ